jgi:hypothetical protein
LGWAILSLIPLLLRGRFALSVQSFQSLLRVPASDALNVRVGFGANDLADQILGRNASRLGFDIAGLAADLGNVNLQNPDLGAQLGSLIQTQLTPVEMGQLLSGRYGGVGQSPLQAPMLYDLNSVSTVSKPASAKADAAPPTTKASDIATATSPDAAPAKIQFAPEVQKVFETLRHRSFPGGKSKEQGGTIVADAKGRLSIQNIGGEGSTSGSFTPKLTLKDPSKYSAVGVFHTHPYDKSEGSYTGVSLSGADAGTFINSGLKIDVAQSGAKQFVFVRTDKTPASVDAAKLDTDQNARIAELIDKGYTFPQASRMAAAETAKAYDLAYYEGSGGTLVRK